MKGIFARHPLPWSAIAGDVQASVVDADGVLVPIQAGCIQQASLIASLANTLKATTDALLAAECAFVWMEGLGCVIEDGGTDAAQKVSWVLEGLRESGLI
jgi:hypothetical protein